MQKFHLSCCSFLRAILLRGIAVNGRQAQNKATMASVGGKSAQAIGLVLALGLAGCSGEDILPGERQSLEGFTKESPIAVSRESDFEAVLDAPVSLASWQGNSGFRGGIDSPLQGEVIWTKRLSQRAPGSYASTLVTTPAIVFAMDDSDRLRAIDRVSGKSLGQWRLSRQSDSFGNFLLLPDHETLVVARGNGQVILYDWQLTEAAGKRAITLTPRWQVDTKVPIHNEPVVSHLPEVPQEATTESFASSDRRTLYILTVHNVLLAFDLDTGEEQWRTVTVPTAIRHLSSAGLASEPLASGAATPRLFAGYSNGELVAIDPLGGRKEWVFYPSQQGRTDLLSRLIDVVAGPIWQQGSLYFATADGRVRSVSADSGFLRWQLNASTIEPLLASGNLVTFVTPEGRLTGVDDQTGEVVWQTIPRLLRKRHVGLNPRDEALAALFEEHAAENTITLEKTGGVSRPIQAGKDIVVIDAKGHLMTFDADNGTLLARTRIARTAVKLVIPTQSGVLVQEKNGRLIAIR
ncbi:MAG: PQQ-binding-like beta-propeller repeat protein [Alphaproteobacteria bacterium]|nr:PQQ-binding-like beta-propeller repeat protein [Alphaproteobacteria bacterium]